MKKRTAVEVCRDNNWCIGDRLIYKPTGQAYRLTAFGKNMVLGTRLQEYATDDDESLLKVDSEHWAKAQELVCSYCGRSNWFGAGATDDELIPESDEPGTTEDASASTATIDYDTMAIHYQRLSAHGVLRRDITGGATFQTIMSPSETLLAIKYDYAYIPPNAAIVVCRKYVRLRIGMQGPNDRCFIIRDANHARRTPQGTLRNSPQGTTAQILTRVAKDALQIDDDPVLIGCHFSTCDDAEWFGDLVFVFSTVAPTHSTINTEL